VLAEQNQTWTSLFQGRAGRSGQAQGQP
jgi:hypothetical protein